MSFRTLSTSMIVSALSVSWKSNGFKRCSVIQEICSVLFQLFYLCCFVLLVHSFIKYSFTCLHSVFVPAVHEAEAFSFLNLQKETVVYLSKHFVHKSSAAGVEK